MQMARQTHIWTAKCSLYAANFCKSECTSAARKALALYVCLSLTSTVTNGYICSAAMLAHGSAARSSTLSLWLSVTMMTGCPSSFGLRSIDSTSPLTARATVAVVQMAYNGFLEGLSTLTGVVGCALFMLLGVVLLPPDLLPVGVPALRSGELLPRVHAAPFPLARAWHGRMAAKPQVMLQCSQHKVIPTVSSVDWVLVNAVWAVILRVQAVVLDSLPMSSNMLIALHWMGLWAGFHPC